MAPKLFLLGVGFIGGTLLNRFVNGERKGDYEIYALTRKDEQIAKLKELDVHPVKGSLDDHEVIKQQTIDSDVVIHAATADHLPSVKAILEGIESRPDKSKKIIYIHTSGAGVLCRDDRGKVSDYIYDDGEPEKIDQRVPDTAVHRNVDLFIKQFIEDKRGGEGARIQIVAPPLIYGIGDGPFNKTSVQIPFLVKMAAASDWSYVGYLGEGNAIWNNIEVHNLVDGYERLLAHLESQAPEPSKGLYWFCEQGEHSWKALCESIAQALYSIGKLKSPEAHTWVGDEYWEKISNGVVIGYGTNSRGRATRLRELGWEPNVKKTVFESVLEGEEIKETLKRFGF